MYLFKVHLLRPLLRFLACEALSLPSRSCQHLALLAVFIIRDGNFQPHVAININYCQRFVVTCSI
jgi:hypothetical protein